MYLTCPEVHFRLLGMEQGEGDSTTSSSSSSPPRKRQKPEPDDDGDKEETKQRGRSARSQGGKGGRARSGRRAASTRLGGSGGGIGHTEGFVCPHVHHPDQTHFPCCLQGNLGGMFH